MKHGFYVLSTHWDREWYQPFQYYRERLVMLMDRTLSALESGHLQGPFQTDGQTIILEDYLEVRPEQRKRIEQMGADGKLAMGPWYVMPDEFLVSGESLLRNLRLGHEVARQFGGEPSRAGFVCDIFGHNSQMPQILKGFGLKCAFVWRGTNDVERAHFNWVGADGTTLPTYRFGQWGYSDFAFHVRKVFGMPQGSPERQPEADFKKFLDYESGRSSGDTVLIFDGCDHLEYDEAIYNMVMDPKWREQGYAINHGTLDEYIDQVLDGAEAFAEESIHGELREAGTNPYSKSVQWLIPGVASSRVWIKQENTACQNLLVHWAEPLGTMQSRWLDAEYPQGYLNIAWRWLIKNHPHDSICGCSIDTVHEDMKFRFSQCRQIAELTRARITQTLTASIQGDIEDDALRVTVFNPLPYPRDKVVELELDIPTDWTEFQEFFGFEAKPAFRLYRPDGTELPYQRLGQKMNVTRKRIFRERVPEALKANVVKVAVELSLPAMGYTTLTAKAQEQVVDFAPNAAHATRHPATPSLVCGINALENEYLRIEPGAGSGIKLTDKQTGRIYDRQFLYEDCADIGDGWYHGVAVNDRVFTSNGASTSFSVDASGPLEATLTMHQRFSIPSDFDFKTMRRSDALVDQEIKTTLTLRKGEPFVDVTAEIENVAEDHRLRVLFPTGLEADRYWVDTPFDAVSRPIALPEDNHLRRELAVEAGPCQSWTALSDDTAGLALATNGLIESAVCDNDDRPIAITLLRSTRRTVFTDGEPEGLLKGSRLRFALRLMPFAGPVEPVSLGRHAQDLCVGVHCAQQRRADQMLHQQAITLPPVKGFWELEGRALMSACQMVNGATEIRLLNPTAQPQRVSIRQNIDTETGGNWTRATPVDFESRPTGDPVALEQGRLDLKLNSKQILTLRMEG